MAWFVEEFGVVSVRECWEKTGKPPKSVRWVASNKWSDEDLVMRCRLVTRDFKGKGERDREDLFAGTPPLEAKRMLFSRVVTRRKGKGTRGGS